MQILFQDSGIIANQASNKRSSNPWETHYYEHQILSTDMPEIYEIILKTEYWLTGDVPLDVVIDENGKLSGYVKLLDEQTIDIPKYPKETIKLDGSNWLHNGRPKAAYVDFTFQVHKKLTYEEYYKDLNMDTFNDLNDINMDGYDDVNDMNMDGFDDLRDIDMDGIDDETKEEIDTKLYRITEYEDFTEVTIRVIKNNSIDNYIFVKNYLKAGYPLMIGKDTYSYKHLNLFTQVHPGPFK